MQEKVSSSGKSWPRAMTWRLFISPKGRSEAHGSRAAAIEGGLKVVEERRRLASSNGLVPSGARASFADAMKLAPDGRL